MSRRIIMKSTPKQNAINIVVDNVYSKIDGLNNERIIDTIDNGLSYFVQGYMFTKAYRKGYWDKDKNSWAHWDGKTHLFSKKHEFLTGLLDRVIDILQNYNVLYKIIDNRKDIKPGKKIKITNMELRYYQQEAIKVAIKKKTGIIKIATGGGKTAVLAGIISNFNMPTIVYVPGIDLLYQTRDALEKFLHNTKIGIIGDGVADVKKITVCTIWSCVKSLDAKYEKFGEEDSTKAEKFNAKNKLKIREAIKNTNLMLVDECQFLGTSTLQHINKASINARYKFGLSATVKREDQADLLIEGVAGNNIIEVTASQLISDGFLAPPVIYFSDVPSMSGLKDNYQSVYKNYIVENEIRNAKIIKAANKLADDGHKILILIKNIRHGEILLEMFGDDRVVYFVRGALKSEERNEIKDSFVAGEFQILIASSVYDQGIDIPMLDCLILACGGKSVGRLFQRVGRVIRPFPGKEKAIILDFVDNAKYLLSHSKSRINTYKQEPKFIIKMPKGKTNGKIKKTKTIRLQKKEGW